MSNNLVTNAPSLGNEKPISLTDIANQLSDIYDLHEARAFLYSSQRLLEGKSPAELIEAGEYKQVMEFIQQVRDGVHI